MVTDGPERPERLRLGRSVRSGCALDGAAGVAAPWTERPDATQRNCVERWLIDGGRMGRTDVVWMVFNVV